MSFEKKYINRTMGRMIIATSLITAITSTSLEAAECEIKGLNIARAYSRALNNGADFNCSNYSEDRKRFERSTRIKFLPFPDKLQCFNSMEFTYTKTRFVAFNKRGQWPLNGWKISRYKMTGNGGRKITSNYGGIVFESQGGMLSKSRMTLKKFWLKKNGASCSNVISKAFGD